MPGSQMRLSGIDGLDCCPKRIPEMEAIANKKRTNRIMTIAPYRQPESEGSIHLKRISKGPAKEDLLSGRHRLANPSPEEDPSPAAS